MAGKTGRRNGGRALRPLEGRAGRTKPQPPEDASGGALLDRHRKASAFDEGKHVGVEPVGVDLREAVAAALIDLEDRSLDQLCRLLGGGFDRHDLVVVAVMISVGRSVALRSAV